MKLEEYKEQVKRTLPDLKPPYYNNIHMLMGMVTEIGELMDTYKKDLAYCKEIDMVNVVEELGDIMWYIMNFCNINHIDLETVFSVNIDKLKARYPDKFSQGKAINRDLDKERTVLEFFSVVDKVDDKIVIYDDKTNQHILLTVEEYEKLTNLKQNGYTVALEDLDRLDIDTLDTSSLNVVHSC